MKFNLSKIFEKYYQKNRKRIQSTIEALSKTKYGKICRIKPDLHTYLSFTKSVPVFNEKLLLKHEKNIVLGKISSYRKVATSGTMGKPKIVYKKRIIRGQPVIYSKKIDKLIKRNKTIIIHTSRLNSNFIYANDMIYKYLYPKIRIFKPNFNSPVELSKIVKLGKILIFYDILPPIYRFLYSLKMAIKLGLIKRNELKKKFIGIGITGEVMKSNDIYKIYKQVKTVFGIYPYIVLNYGMNEIGKIGYCIYRPNKKIIYNIFSTNVFIEILSPETNIPVFGRMGEIVITSFSTTGSIIVRYRTGDLGKMFFLRGKPFLQIYGRLKHLKYMLGRAKFFSLLSIEHLITKRFNLNLKLRCKRILNKETGTEYISIKIYGPPIRKELKKRISEFIKNKIRKSVSTLIKEKLLVINVTFTTKYKSKI